MPNWPVHVIVSLAVAKSGNFTAVAADVSDVAAAAGAANTAAAAQAVAKVRNKRTVSPCRCWSVPETQRKTALPGAFGEPTE